MIELKIAKAIRDYALKDDIIEWIADSCVEDHDRRVSESHLSVFEDQLAEVNRSIKNVMSAIEKGIITETTKGRLMELEAERTAIEGKICAAKAAIVPTNRERLVEWLRSLREGDVHDKKYQAGLFDTFLVAAYLYDDNRVKIVFSFAGDKNTIEIPLEDVIDSIDDEASCVRLSSTLSHQNRRTFQKECPFSVLAEGGCGFERWLLETAQWAVSTTVASVATEANPPPDRQARVWQCDHGRQ